MTNKRNPNYFSRNLTNLLLAIILIFVLALVAYTAIKYELALAIAFLGIFISTFFAARSLKIANKSLEISRSNIRPFIYIQNNLTTIYLNKNDIKLEFIIKNDGVLPGEITSTESTFFRKDEIVTTENSSAIHPIRYPPRNFNYLLFPGNSTTVGVTIENRSPEYKQFEDDLDNGRLVIRNCVLYKKDDLEYETIQTMLLRKQGPTSWAFLHLPPQHWT